MDEREHVYQDGWTDRRLPRWLILIIFILTPAVWGCAHQERFLTAEQDAKMREICESAGCEIITSPQWQVIETILSSMGYRIQ